jgi:anti-anti-sigma factor
MAGEHTMTQERPPFTIERIACDDRGTLILRFSGALTARDMYAQHSPIAVRSLLDVHCDTGSEPLTLNIFDLSQVPYMDSSGLGLIARHYAHCQGRGVRFIAAAPSQRVRELFRLTKMDTVIPIAATLEEALA